MAKVLVSDKLSAAGLAKLRESCEVDEKVGLSEAELAAAISGYDALVVRSASKVTRKVIEAGRRLRVIGRAGIGVDNVDVEAATRRGIVVMNTPTGNAVTTAEHALALLFALARKIPQATASMRGGKWEKTRFQGRELHGKTLGVVGLGNIGRIVADRAQGLKMKVIGYDPVLTPERAAQIGVELVSLDALLARADAITVHTPLTPETQGLVNDATIEKLKKGVLLVNAARGGIYDEAALARGLDAGKIGGVALDVFVEEPVAADHPLLRYENVIVTPHLGASTQEAQERVALEIAEQVAAYLQHGVVTNAVNVASISRERAEQLGPWTALASQLGRLLPQVAPTGEAAPTEIEVEVAGEPSELGATVIAHHAVAAYLAHHLGGDVNIVNAASVASERGIQVAVRKLVKGRMHTNVVALAVRGPGYSHDAAGTLATDRTPRLSRLEGCDLDAVIDGDLLITWNANRPGVIGAVGTLLGQRGINISRMQLGLEATSQRAVGVWNVDSAVPADALDALRGVAGMERALAARV